MGFEDLGSKNEPCGESPSKIEAPRITYPGFTINRSGALDLKPDEVVEVKVKLRFKGFSKSDYGPKDKPFRNEFDIMAVDWGKNQPEEDTGAGDADDEDGGPAEIQSKLEAGLKERAAAKD